MLSPNPRETAFTSLSSPSRRRGSGTCRSLFHLRERTTRGVTPVYGLCLPRRSRTGAGAGESSRHQFSQRAAVENSHKDRVGDQAPGYRAASSCRRRRRPTGSKATVTPPVAGHLTSPPGLAWPQLGRRVEAGQVLGVVQPHLVGSDLLTFITSQQQIQAMELELTVKGAEADAEAIRRGWPSPRGSRSYNACRHFLRACKNITSQCGGGTHVRREPSTHGRLV